MSDFFTNLREQRDERVQDLHLDLPIPTWDGGLIARFDVLDTKTVKKYAQGKKTLEDNCDFIIRATRELYALDRERLVDGAQRMEENEDYVRIEDEESLPVKFDQSFTEKMGVTGATSARDVLLYCVKNNGVALQGFCGRLLTWMQNTDAEVADGLVGEA